MSNKWRPAASSSQQQQQQQQLQRTQQQNDNKPPPAPQTSWRGGGGSVTTTAPITKTVPIKTLSSSSSSSSSGKGGFYVPPSARSRTNQQYSENKNQSPDRSYANRTARKPPKVTPAPLLNAHGDSFVGVLSRLKPGIVDIGWYSGASAKGLANPDSTKQVGRKLLRHIDTKHPSNVLMCFGQVDLNMNYLYQLRSKPLTESVGPEEFTTNVIEKYLAFIKENLVPRVIGGGSDQNNDIHTIEETSKQLSQMSLFQDRPQTKPYIKKLILCTALLPVVSDDTITRFIVKYSTPKDGPPPPPEVVHLEDHVELSGIATRRRMIKRFNDAIQTFSNEYQNLGYDITTIDINKHLVDPENPDVVSPKYLSEDPTNVHVLWENTVQFWVKELTSVGLNESHIRDDLEASANDYKQRKEKTMQEVHGRIFKDDSNAASSTSLDTQS